MLTCRRLVRRTSLPKRAASLLFIFVHALQQKINSSYHRRRASYHVLDLLNALKVPNGFHAELEGGVLVAHHHCPLVELDGRGGVHMVDALLDAARERRRRGGAGHYNDDLARVHDGSDAHGERQLGHACHVAVKLPRARRDRAVRQGLDAGARRERRAGLVVGKMSLGTNT